MRPAEITPTTSAQPYCTDKMNVTSTSSYNNLWQLLQELQASQTDSTSSTSSLTNLLSENSTSSTNSASGDSSSVSSPGQLFSELQKLSQSDPAEFKKITAQIATQLQAAAKNSTNSEQANFLNQMAANFQKASQSGNFSDLFPNQSQTSNSVGGTGGGHHHHAHGHSDSDSDTTSLSSSSSNPISSIFSQALSQITADFASISNTNSTT